MPEARSVELALYDLAGQRVRRLASGFQEAGMHAVEWDGPNDAGRALATGIYLVRLQAGGACRVCKVTLLR
ncbi:MAG: FlgD immunoglobulin-like domain containing protein [Candidatus Latescibacterota bacterium]